MSVAIACSSALALLVGLTGCAGDRHTQSTGPSVDDHRTVDRGDGQSTDQSIEDKRTAERIREALAAASEYKFAGVQVAAGNGVIQLSGLVNTSAQRGTVPARSPAKSWA